MKIRKHLTTILTFVLAVTAILGFTMFPVKSVKAETEYETLIGLKNSISIRDNDGEIGLRFIAEIDKEWYDELANDSNVTFKFGILVNSKNNYDKLGADSLVVGAQDVREGFVQKVEGKPAPNLELNENGKYEYYATVLYTESELIKAFEQLGYQGEQIDERLAAVYATKLVARPYFEIKEVGKDNIEYYTDASNLKAYSAIHLANAGMLQNQITEELALKYLKSITYLDGLFVESDGSVIGVYANDFDFENNTFTDNNSALPLEFNQVFNSEIDYAKDARGVLKVSSVGLENKVLGEEYTLSMFDDLNNVYHFNYTYVSNAIEDAKELISTFKWTPAQLAVNTGYYVLANDIDATGYEMAHEYDGTNASSVKGFEGTFDGLGHTVSNLTIAENNALFIKLDGNAQIKNVAFENVLASYATIISHSVSMNATVKNIYVKYNDATQNPAGISSGDCVLENVVVDYNGASFVSVEEVGGVEAIVSAGSSFIYGGPANAGLVGNMSSAKNVVVFNNDSNMPLSVQGCDVTEEVLSSVGSVVYAYNEDVDFNGNPLVEEDLGSIENVYASYSKSTWARSYANASEMSEDTYEETVDFVLADFEANGENCWEVVDNVPYWKGTYKATNNSKNVIITTDLELNSSEDVVIVAYGDKNGYATILEEGELGDNQYRITTNSNLIKLVANANNTYSISYADDITLAKAQSVVITVSAKNFTKNVLIKLCESEIVVEGTFNGGKVLDKITFTKEGDTANIYAVNKITGEKLTCFVSSSNDMLNIKAEEDGSYTITLKELVSDYKGELTILVSDDVLGEITSVIKVETTELKQISDKIYFSVEDGYFYYNNRLVEGLTKVELKAKGITQTLTDSAFSTNGTVVENGEYLANNKIDTQTLGWTTKVNIYSVSSSNKIRRVSTNIWGLHNSENAADEGSKVGLVMDTVRDDTNDYEVVFDSVEFLLTIGNVRYSFRNVDMPTKVITKASDLERFNIVYDAENPVVTTDRGYYVMLNDVDASDVVISHNQDIAVERNQIDTAWGQGNGVREYRPYGYAGMFDGLGHAIINLDLSDGDGLFGYMKAGPIVKDVDFVNLNATNGYVLARYMDTGECFNAENKVHAQGQAYNISNETTLNVHVYYAHEKELSKGFNGGKPYSTKRTGSTEVTMASVYDLIGTFNGEEIGSISFDNKDDVLTISGLTNTLTGEEIAVNSVEIEGDLYCIPNGDGSYTIGITVNKDVDCDEVVIRINIDDSKFGNITITKQAPVTFSTAPSIFARKNGEAFALSANGAYTIKETDVFTISLVDLSISKEYELAQDANEDGIINEEDLDTYEYYLEFVDAVDYVLDGNKIKANESTTTYGTATKIKMTYKRRGEVKSFVTSYTFAVSQVSPTINVEMVGATKSNSVYSVYGGEKLVISYKDGSSILPITAVTEDRNGDGKIDQNDLQDNEFVIISAGHYLVNGNELCSYEKSGTASYTPVPVYVRISGKTTSTSLYPKFWASRRFDVTATLNGQPTGVYVNQSYTIKATDNLVLGFKDIVNNVAFTLGTDKDNLNDNEYFLEFEDDYYKLEGNKVVSNGTYGLPSKVIATYKANGVTTTIDCFYLTIEEPVSVIEFSATKNNESYAVVEGGSYTINETDSFLVNLYDSTYSQAFSLAQDTSNLQNYEYYLTVADGNYIVDGNAIKVDGNTAVYGAPYIVTATYMVKGVEYTKSFNLTINKVEVNRTVRLDGTTTNGTWYYFYKGEEIAITAKNSLTGEAFNLNATATTVDELQDGEYMIERIVSGAFRIEENKVIATGGGTGTSGIRAVAKVNGQLRYSAPVYLNFDNSKNYRINLSATLNGEAFTLEMGEVVNLIKDTDELVLSLVDVSNSNAPLTLATSKDSLTNNQYFIEFENDYYKFEGNNVVANGTAYGTPAMATITYKYNDVVKTYTFILNVEASRPAPVVEVVATLNSENVEISDSYTITENDEFIVNLTDTANSEDFVLVQDLAELENYKYHLAFADDYYRFDNGKVVLNGTYDLASTVIITYMVNDEIVEIRPFTITIESPASVVEFSATLDGEDFVVESNGSYTIREDKVFAINLYDTTYSRDFVPVNSDAVLNNYEYYITVENGTYMVDGATIKANGNYNVPSMVSITYKVKGQETTVDCFYLTIESIDPTTVIEYVATFNGETAGAVNFDSKDDVLEISNVINTFTTENFVIDTDGDLTAGEFKVECDNANLIVTNNDGVVSIAIVADKSIPAGSATITITINDSRYGIVTLTKVVQISQIKVQITVDTPIYLDSTTGEVYFEGRKVEGITSAKRNYYKAQGYADTNMTVNADGTLNNRVSATADVRYANTATDKLVLVQNSQSYLMKYDQTTHEFVSYDGPNNYVYLTINGEEYYFTTAIWATKIIDNKDDLSVLNTVYTEGTDTSNKGYYILINDIDATGFRFNHTSQITDNPPTVDGNFVNYTSYGFSGIFDGLGHTIYNLDVSGTEEVSGVGMFGIIKNAYIRNFNLVNLNAENGYALAYQTHKSYYKDASTTQYNAIYMGDINIRYAHDINLTSGLTKELGWLSNIYDNVLSSSVNDGDSDYYYGRLNDKVGFTNNEYGIYNYTSALTQNDVTFGAAITDKYEIGFKGLTAKTFAISEDDVLEDGEVKLDSTDTKNIVITPDYDRNVYTITVSENYNTTAKDAVLTLTFKENGEEVVKIITLKLQSNLAYQGVLNGTNTTATWQYIDADDVYTVAPRNKLTGELFTLATDKTGDGVVTEADLGDNEYYVYMQYNYFNVDGNRVVYNPNKQGYGWDYAWAKTNIGGNVTDIMLNQVNSRKNATMSATKNGNAYTVQANAEYVIESTDELVVALTDTYGSNKAYTYATDKNNLQAYEFYYEFENGTYDVENGVVKANVTYGVRDKVIITFKYGNATLTMDGFYLTITAPAVQESVVEFSATKNGQDFAVVENGEYTINETDSFIVNLTDTTYGQAFNLAQDTSNLQDYEYYLTVADNNYVVDGALIKANGETTVYGTPYVITTTYKVNGVEYTKVFNLTIKKVEVNRTVECLDGVTTNGTWYYFYKGEAIAITAKNSLTGEAFNLNATATTVDELQDGEYMIERIVSGAFRIEENKVIATGGGTGTSGIRAVAKVNGQIRYSAPVYLNFDNSKNYRNYSFNLTNNGSAATVDGSSYKIYKDDLFLVNVINTENSQAYEVVTAEDRNEDGVIDVNDLENGQFMLTSSVASASVLDGNQVKVGASPTVHQIFVTAKFNGKEYNEAFWVNPVSELRSISAVITVNGKTVTGKWQSTFLSGGGEATVHLKNGLTGENFTLVTEDKNGDGAVNELDLDDGEYYLYAELGYIIVEGNNVYDNPDRAYGYDYVRGKIKVNGTIIDMGQIVALYNK